MSRLCVILLVISLSSPAPIGAAVEDAKTSGPRARLTRPAAVADAKVVGPKSRMTRPSAVADAKVLGSRELVAGPHDVVDAGVAEGSRASGLMTPEDNVLLLLEDGRYIVDLNAPRTRTH